MTDDESGSWDYKPDGQNVSKQPELPSSDAGKTRHRQPELKPVSWTASEFIDHSRGAVWYILLSLITVLLAALVYWLTKDRFATGLVVVVGIIVGVFSLKKPQELTYELSESGLRAGEKIYPYRLFKSFTIIHEGALSTITFLPIKKFMPALSIFFDTSDEEKIVKILSQHLPYEQRGLDAMDRLTRRLRF